MTATTHYMIVKQSDLYPASHFRSGLFFASLTLMLVYFLPFHWQDPIWLLYIEVCAFFGGYLFAYNRKVKRFFTFKGEMREEVHQKALESMREYGISGKPSTIFLFASQTEKCVTCILSPDLEEREEDRKIQKLIKKTLKEKRPNLKNGLNRQGLEELGQDIKEIFFPKTSYGELIEEKEETRPASPSEESMDGDTKTLDQESSPDSPALEEEKKLTQTTADKTDLKEESQTPEV